MPGIRKSHVEAVHGAAREDESRAKEYPPDSGRYTAAMERARLLREVQWYLLQLIPEQERWTYLPFVGDGRPKK